MSPPDEDGAPGSEAPAGRRGRPPRRRSRGARNPFVTVLNGIVMLFVLLAIGAVAAVYWGQSRFTAPGPLTEDVTVLVARGSGLQSIARQLEAQGVVDDDVMFEIGVRAYRHVGELRAGEYSIPAGASMREVMDVLVSGRAVMHFVTIPEGLTSRQIVACLTAETTLVEGYTAGLSSRQIENCRTGSAILTGEIAEIPPEGTLLPQTYDYDRGATRQQIIDRMSTAMAEAVAEAWEGRDPDLPLETPEELVTLASIVEKETGVAEERPMVAAVFVNRLERGMRLQSDPTIIYGIVGGEATLGRGLRRSEIDTPTPYNTYQIDGLPAGPIANPGPASLEAAAHPADTDALYFVADGTGGHAFAATLEEHNRNVARWRQIEADAAAPAAAAPAAAPAEGAAPG